MTDQLNQQDNEINNEVNIDAQGKQMASLLDAHAKRLSMRTLKQLEDGRERAVKAHAQQIAGLGTNKDGTLTGVFSWLEHHRVASTALLLGAIISGFVLMQAFSQHHASDAYLLSADLPPEAFVDRGFEPSLNTAKL